ncbi:MAG: GNAT family N-acetyltransferase [Actinomycetota bacterium]
MPVTFTSDVDAVDWAQAKADLAADAFDNGRSPKALRRSFANAQHVALALDGARCVGMARLLSDGVCNAYLVDVWTHSGYRRQGIATRLVRSLLDAVPGQHVALQTDSAAALYASIGFEPDHGWMTRVVGTWLDNEGNR